MIRFALFFLDHYFRMVSDERFQRFSSDHIVLLEGNARFAHLGHPTRSAHEAYFGARSGQDVTATARVGVTQARMENLTEFLELVSRHAGAIQSRWGKESLQYRRFYPQGISEYRQANLQEIAVLMERYRNALEEFGGQLPEQVLADFLVPLPAETRGESGQPEGGVILRFGAARAGQLAAKGRVAAQRGQRTESRQALEFQILENVLTVALAVLREPAEAKQQALRLFPQHLLRRPRKTKKEEAETQDLVTQGAAAHAEDRELASTRAAAPSERGTSDQPTAQSPVTAEVENTLPG